MAKNVYIICMFSIILLSLVAVGFSQTRTQTQSQSQIQTQTPDPCAGKLDGTYCLNTFAYTCGFGRMVGVQSCTYCIQNTATSAFCSSYVVPSDFCTLRTSGYYCYRPIGSSIQTSIQCDLQQVFQQFTCSANCDDTSGQCSATTAIGTTPAPCSATCRNGCDIYGNCKPPPFCSDSTSVDISQTPFCGQFLTNRNVATQLNLYAQDNDAKNQFITISNWNNATFSSLCQQTIKQFICESKFKNCNERTAGYTTCKSSCLSAVTCMQQYLSTLTSGVISPINCKIECNSANLFSAFSIGTALIILLAAVL